MQEIKLLRAGVADIPAIRELAVRIWNQHYPTVISRRQIDYMLDKMYSENSLLQQMQEKQHQFFYIVAGQEKAGFISLFEEKSGHWFINKYYIDQQKAAKGLGSAAFKELVKHTSATTFHLTVNRQNYKAINFYFKNGFTIESVADFDIGDGYEMNDFVMVWNSKLTQGKLGQEKP